MGLEGAGLFALLAERRGGYYISAQGCITLHAQSILTCCIDVGASELVADGSIKVKQGSGIARYTSKGLVFDDGAELDADVVVFATG